LEFFFYIQLFGNCGILEKKGAMKMYTNQQHAKTQYNGIILISSYIHRLFVQQSIEIRLLNEKTHWKLDQYKEMLNDVSLIMSMFEQTKDLTVNQHDKLIEIYSQTNDQFSKYFKPEPTFLEKVAIVASSFYGERHLNEKIIHLSKLFDVTIASDYEKRIQFYDERIKLMDFVVHALSQGDDLKPDLVQQIEMWYSNVNSIKQPIMDDLSKIPLLLNAN